MDQNGGHGFFEDVCLDFAAHTIGLSTPIFLDLSRCEFSSTARLNSVRDTEQTGPTIVTERRSKKSYTPM
jgi:hypothetical protein